jgi:ribonucleoside-diphosphate reductase beta chain
VENTVFYHNKIHFKKEPLFFGTGANLQEYADPRFPTFEKADNTMMGFFWRPEEVGLQKDRADFKKMTEGEKFIFVSNLKYQMLLDSIQGRGPLLAFLPVTTNPEFEACVITWGFFEKIHSRSYTHIIRNLFPNPSDVTDHILDIPEIIERASSIGKYYDDFIDLVHKYKVDPSSVSDHEIKTKLYLALMCINILEGIRFYVSFACNFAFGENKILEGSSKIMGLIARDEAQHLALTQNALKVLRSGEDGPEWVNIAKECEQQCVQMFADAATQEKMWAAYLFDKGAMIGLNAKVLDMYIDHMTNKRMRGVGLTPIFPSTRNPLGWMDNWLNSKGLQEAPQETEKESYVVGAVNSDIDEDEFDDLGF